MIFASRRMAYGRDLATTMPLVYLVVFNEEITSFLCGIDKVGTVMVQIFCVRIVLGFASVLAGCGLYVVSAGAETCHHYST